jgi:phage terminase large subunit-like protein
LTADGIRLGGGLDFVATTATGGALRAHLADNDVTVVFGATTADADNINQAYHRFHSQNVGIDDVLRQQGNVVMLWHQHPSDADAARITACLE